MAAPFDSATDCLFCGKPVPRDPVTIGVYALALSREHVTTADWFGAHEECLRAAAHADADLPSLGTQKSYYPLAGDTAEERAASDDLNDATAGIWRRLEEVTVTPDELHSFAAAVRALTDERLRRQA